MEDKCRAWSATLTDLNQRTFSKLANSPRQNKDTISKLATSPSHSESTISTLTTSPQDHLSKLRIETRVNLHNLLELNNSFNEGNNLLNKFHPSTAEFKSFYYDKRNDNSLSWIDSLKDNERHQQEAEMDFRKETVKTKDRFTFHLTKLDAKELDYDGGGCKTMPSNQSKITASSGPFILVKLKINVLL